MQENFKIGAKELRPGATTTGENPPAVDRQLLKKGCKPGAFGFGRHPPVFGHHQAGLGVVFLEEGWGFQKAFVRAWLDANPTRQTTLSSCLAHRVRRLVG